MTLEEHYEAIQTAIDAAREEGFDVKATTCCCGEGLYIAESESTAFEFFSVDEQ